MSLTAKSLNGKTLPVLPPLMLSMAVSSPTLKKIMYSETSHFASHLVSPVLFKHSTPILSSSVVHLEQFSLLLVLTSKKFSAPPSDHTPNYLKSLKLNVQWTPPLMAVASSPNKIPAKDRLATFLLSLQTAYPKLHSFLVYLQSTYPEFTFQLGQRFTFRPPHTIILEPLTTPPQPNYALLTLHELSHALCKHKDYQTNLKRLKIEVEAWEYAKNLLKLHPEWLKTYPLKWDEDFVQAQLDTYRDWLHQKSTCHTCHLTRFQAQNGTYYCPHCDYFIQ